MLLLLWLVNQVYVHIAIALCIYFNLVLFDAAVPIFFIDVDDLDEAYGFVIIDLITFIIVALVIAVDVVETFVGLVSWKPAEDS